MSDLAVAITAHASDATDASSHTFTNQSIGGADATRLVVVSSTTRGGTNPTSVTGITFAGNAGNQLVAQSNSLNGNNYAGFFSLAMPTGTTATFVVSFNASVQRSTLIVYSITGDTASLLDTAANLTAGGSGTTPIQLDMNIDLADGGVLLGAMTCATTTGTLGLSYSGATDDPAGTQAVEALRTLGATRLPTADQSGATVSSIWSRTGTTDALGPTSVLVSFSPPAGGLSIPVAMFGYRRMNTRLPRHPRHPQPDGYIRRRSGLYVRDTKIKRAA